MLRNSVDSNTQSNINYICNAPLIIGAEPGSNANANPTSYFKGKIDDVRTYNRALSDGEIYKMYSIEKTK